MRDVDWLSRKEVGKPLLEVQWHVCTKSYADQNMSEDYVKSLRNAFGSYKGSKSGFEVIKVFK